MPRGKYTESSTQRLYRADLQKLVADVGLNQADLAEQLNISASTIGYYLSGRSPIPYVVLLAMRYLREVLQQDKPKAKRSRK